MQHRAYRRSRLQRSSSSVASSGCRGTSVGAVGHGTRRGGRSRVGAVGCSRTCTASAGCAYIKRHGCAMHRRWTVARIHFVNITRSWLAHAPESPQESAVINTILSQVYCIRHCADTMAGWRPCADCRQYLMVASTINTIKSLHSSRVHHKYIVPHKSAYNDARAHIFFSTCSVRWRA